MAAQRDMLSSCQLLGPCSIHSPHVAARCRMQHALHELEAARSGSQASKGARGREDELRTRCALSLLQKGQLVSRDDSVLSQAASANSCQPVSGLQHP